MRSWGTNPGRLFARRALALLACTVLLYFAAGGSLFHQHTGGPETPCHICQALHLPVLASASLHLVAAPELIARYSSLPKHVAPCDSFSLHRASRAPPLA
jgi:disulfide bond formation protein DsbB